MYIPDAILQPYIVQGLISEQRHPFNDALRIYNYTHQCQFARAWDDITLRCRGLIQDVQHEHIVCNVMQKFFNIEEHVTQGHALPVEEPLITEKIDGSLGILYWLNDEPWIATRGSFTSEQAQWATAWFRRYVPNGFFSPWDNVTHMFEIVYAANRIVVQYDFEGLVHLATRDTTKVLRPGGSGVQAGEERPLAP